MDTAVDYTTPDIVLLRTARATGGMHWRVDLMLVTSRWEAGRHLHKQVARKHSR